MIFHIKYIYIFFYLFIFFLFLYILTWNHSDCIFIQTRNCIILKRILYHSITVNTFMSYRTCWRRHQLCLSGHFQPNSRNQTMPPIHIHTRKKHITGTVYNGQHGEHLVGKTHASSKGHVPRAQGSQSPLVFFQQLEPLQLSFNKISIFIIIIIHEFQSDASPEELQGRCSVTVFSLWLWPVTNFHVMLVTS